MRKRTVVLLCAVTAVLAACGAAVANSQLEEIDEKANNYRAFIPKNNVERNNYEAAQKLYDDPTTIIWCSAFPQNPTAPTITVPIAGKLTSSSVSFFPSSRVKYGGDTGKEYTPERRSVDGMYHGTPPPYRYGFTPGGQYVDFFNLPTICTTQPYRFKRQTVLVTVANELNEADKQATDALRRGNKAEAQRILEAAAP